MTARCPHTLDEFVRFGLDGFDGHGVPGPAMADVFANSGAEVLFSATECFV